MTDAENMSEVVEIKKEWERREGEILSGLTERERRAVELRFGFEGGKSLSYEKIGEELGMTAMGAMKLFKKV